MIEFTACFFSGNANSSSLNFFAKNKSVKTFLLVVLKYEDDENAAASCTTLSCRDSVRQKRSLLFQPSSTAGRSRSSGREKRGRTNLSKGRGLYSLCALHLAL